MVFFKISINIVFVLLLKLIEKKTLFELVIIYDIIKVVDW
jgi:hypothetical protein